MKKAFGQVAVGRLSVIASVVLIASAAFPLWAASRRLVIYHTNDIHGYISAREAFFYKENPKRMIGGFAAFAGVIKKEELPKIWIDSGDFFFASPEGNLTNGESVLTLANALGLAAMAVGNHEFDLGERRLGALAKRAQFPFLAANVMVRKYKTEGERPSYVQPYVIRDVGGVKIGIFGLITPNTPYVTLPKNVRYLKFLRPVNVAANLVKDLRSQGAELIVAASHVGWAGDGEDFEDDKYLASHVPGIDIILGGHTHTRLDRPYQDPANKTIIIQSGSYLTAVGRLELRLGEDGKISKFEHLLKDLWIDETPEDPQTLRVVTPFKDMVDRKLAEVLGETKVDLTSSREGESVLGNIIADCMREAVRADIAMQNSGGIRSSISAGTVTLRHLYNVLPFDNTIYTMTLTGSQVKEVLEASLSDAVIRLQTSGLIFRYDMTRPKGRRLTEVMVGKKPILVTKNYTVATNNFLADGGDGYKTFLNGSLRKDTKTVLRDSMAQWIKKHTPLKPALEGRMTAQRP
ncbi:MAG: 5'-nucleotidase C-terminal domain-containing protein [Elusimicrobiota bacterium]